MAITPNPPAPLAVLPVVDYEPPATTMPRPLSDNSLRSPSPARSRCVQRQAPPSGRPAPAAPSQAMRAAAVFADAALRRVLEVIDRRRPVAALRPLLAAGLVDSVLPAHPATSEPAGAATLRRIRLQLVGAANPPTAAEVFGTYSRAGRTHAVAGRIERCSTAPRWQVVALHIG